jgi:hypothetical protein
MAVSLRSLRSVPGLSLLLLSLVACSNATSHRPPYRDRSVMTASDIRKTGAKTALEAVRLVAPRVFGTNNGERNSTSGPRGRSTFLLTDDPMVFLDGVQVADVSELADMPASDIASIRVMNGIDSSIRFGTGGGNGAILIRTKR